VPACGNVPRRLPSNHPEGSRFTGVGEDVFVQSFRYGRFVHGGLIAGVLATTLMIPSASTARFSVSRTVCPRVASTQVPNVDEVISAARRLLIIGHAAIVQGHRYRLTVKENPVLAAVSLSSPVTPGMNAPEPVAYRRIAVRRCGQAIASRSWAVVYAFPQTTVTSFSIRIAFLVHTSNGWRAY
jgi:hypothetical protein